MSMTYQNRVNARKLNRISHNMLAANRKCQKIELVQLQLVGTKMQKQIDQMERVHNFPSANN